MTDAQSRCVRTTQGAQEGDRMATTPNTTRQTVDEAASKGGFEVQNAVLAAGMSFFDTSTKSSGNVAQQWTEVTRQAQQAALEAWQAGVGAGDKMLASAGEMVGQEAKGRKRS